MSHHLIACHCSWHIYISINLSFCFSPQRDSVAPLCAAKASAVLCIPSIHCFSLCWREGAWMDLFVSIFRFPHAAEHVSVWIQRQNGLPAQAWCSASQWQEVWPFLWQDWHRCGKHINHKGRSTALLLLCIKNHPCGVFLIGILVSLQTKYKMWK